MEKIISPETRELLRVLDPMDDDLLMNVHFQPVHNDWISFNKKIINTNAFIAVADILSITSTFAVMKTLAPVTIAYIAFIGGNLTYNLAEGAIFPNYLKKIIVGIALLVTSVFLALSTCLITTSTLPVIIPYAILVPLGVGLVLHGIRSFHAAQI